MTVSSSQQMTVFIFSVLAGIGCGVFFDFQRSIRRVYGSGAVRTAFQDMLFTAVCAAAAVAVGFWKNLGQVRYFELLGASAGALMYCALLSRFVMRMFCALHRLFITVIIKPLSALVRLAIIPFRRGAALLKRLCAFLNRKIRLTAKKLAKRKRNIKKRINMT